MVGKERGNDREQGGFAVIGIGRHSGIKATLSKVPPVNVTLQEIRERTFAQASHYGQLAGVRYAEPFVQKEVGLVDDLMSLPVASL